MDLVSAIGLISSFVTLEEAGRSGILIIKDKIKRKEIDINNWDSDDSLVQVCLDRFKTDMGDKYKDHIFSEEEIQDIILGFFEQNRELRIGHEEQKQMTQIIEDILYAYNEYAKSLMSSGERTLHNTLSSDFSKIMDVETVVLLSHKKPDGHINVKVEFGEGEGKVPLDNIAKRAESYKSKERVTYKMIKEYIEAKYGFKVHTAYIAEVKRDLGLPMYDAPNAVEKLKQPRKHPTPEKVEAIKDALKHFEVI